MRRLPLVAAAAVLSMSLAACGGSGSTPKSATSPPVGGSSSPGAPGASQPSGSAAPAGGAALIVIKPSPNTAAADPASQISVSVAHGKLTAVTAQLSGGNAVAGTLAGDGLSWTSTS